MSRSTPKRIDPLWLTPAVQDFIHSKIELAESGCWLWRGSVLTTGYGVTTIPGRCDLGQFRLHRLMWVAAHGQDFPPNYDADHLCRVPLCCNPDHIEPVTPWENTLRADNPIAGNVHKVRCPRGHAYDTVVRATGGRACSRCDARLSALRSQRRFASVREARRRLGIGDKAYQDLYGQSGRRAELLLALMDGQVPA